ncbi:Glucose-induced degradation complex subunit [Conglomerata obtusa]
MINDIKNPDKIHELTPEVWESQWPSTSPVDTDSLALNYLIYEGYATEASAFAKEKNLKYEPDPKIAERAKIKQTIERGDIDLAISLINDFNIELLDKNTIVYYYLIEQKAAEMMFEAHLDGYEDKLEDILFYVKEELLGFVKDNPVLTSSFEKLLEYMVFDNEDIMDRRKKVSIFVNQVIMQNDGVVNNELKEIVNGIIAGEKKLSEKYQFPILEDYLNKKL